MKLAVIGDIHGFWDNRDTAFFNHSDYDGLLFVGDLARMTNSLPVARELAGLTLPAWVMPGNHDAVTLMQPMAEIRNRRLLRELACIGMARRVRRLAQALDPVRLRGYTVEQIGHDLGLLSARPHAMGPNHFHYRRYLKRHFGVGDFKASAARLCELVDQAPANLVVLAHNGPAGLGDAPDAPFGCDFDPALGDFGDPDLRVAIDHARATGRRVLAVVAGHMHHRNRKAGIERATWAHDGETLYINAARVPRMRRDGSHRHHVALAIHATAVTAHTVFVDACGQIESREALGPDATMAMHAMP